MTRQEMMQHFDGDRSRGMPAMRAAEARARAKAHHHIRAALAELAQVGPQSVGIGKGLSDCELILNGLVEKIEAEA